VLTHFFAGFPILPEALLLLVRVGRARPRGLMLAVEFPNHEIAETVQWACFQRGLLVLECGAASIRLSPPLVVSDAEVTTALRLFGEAIDDVAARRTTLERDAAAADGANRR